ncbi:MAG TPA: type II toxin-antitoxin system VapC family toxin [Thauera sp.]|uniref:type II toxin-antitoxin system VapC family toxin n=1 Tax=Thauera sp. TaxID=1905334 RepID=UPI002C75A519|nr:type II toxin-antitoxin system VapC family toxin [Thauera sp.]HRP24153.1 type II toxin-antitoxin system VapC family toxin [Thauera sp.]HRP67527.1 type II toxin-antitoxin system VapC family toxin [Thauera sp.]
MSAALVLDTHVLVWLVQGDSRLHAEIVCQIDEFARQTRVLVPAISLWEIGMLVAKGRLQLAQDVQQWVDAVLGLPGLGLAALEPAIAVASSRLPGALHGDPADRMIAATARHHDALLVTADEKLLAYGAAGHLKVMDARGGPG